MELVVTVMVCISFTMLLLFPAPCVSQELQKLPRKLMPSEKETVMRGFTEPEMKNYHVISPGDRSQYYTMDYAFHRRRRPIHNKSSLLRHSIP